MFTNAGFINLQGHHTSEVFVTVAYNADIVSKKEAAATLERLWFFCHNSKIESKNLTTVDKFTNLIEPMGSVYKVINKELTTLLVY